MAEIAGEGRPIRSLVHSKSPPFRALRQPEPRELRRRELRDLRRRELRDLRRRELRDLVAVASIGAKPAATMSLVLFQRSTCKSS